VSTPQPAPQETPKQKPKRMKRPPKGVSSAIIGLVVLGLAVVGVGVTVARTLSPDKPTNRVEAPREWRLKPGVMIEVIPAKIERFVDGDTGIYRLADGRVEQVRMIGIDAPEALVFTDRYTDGALSAARRFSGSNRQVFLELGVNERDRYGQMLAYVWLQKPPKRPTEADVRSKMLNAKMVAAGYAKEFYRVPGMAYANDRYTPLLAAYASQARAQKRGLWDPAFVEAAGYSDAWAVRDSSSSRPIPTRYVGNRTTRKLHRPTCPNAVNMSIGERVHFDKRSVAIASGFVPCNICRP
jgi:micrococcal nuclease